MINAAEYNGESTTAACMAVLARGDGERAAGYKLGTEVIGG